MHRYFGALARIHYRDWMLRATAVAGLVAALTGAPFQCSGTPEPSRLIEETPGQALYELAQDFKKSGDHEAWRRTLERLVARYPSSRFATQAKQDLATARAAAEAGQ